MNYIKTYLKRNNLTRKELAKMVFSSESLIHKVAAGLKALNPRVKRIMQLEEINKKLEAMIIDLNNLIERLKAK